MSNDGTTGYDVLTKLSETRTTDHFVTKDPKGKVTTANRQLHEGRLALKESIHKKSLRPAGSFNFDTAALLIRNRSGVALRPKGLHIPEKFFKEIVMALDELRIRRSTLVIEGASNSRNR